MNHLRRITQFLHHHLLFSLLAMYLVAILAPHWGVWLRSLGTPALSLGGGFTLPKILSPNLMLAFLLFNAGLGVRTEGLRKARSQLGLLAGGVAANAIFPLTFVLLGHFFLGSLLPKEEARLLVASLLLIAAMPIAGSSTAWAQNAQGSMVTSLGLVLFSTMASPLLTPFALGAFHAATAHSYQPLLKDLDTESCLGFLLFSVVAPSLGGIWLRSRLSGARFAALEALAKPANLVNLLVLNYTNAAVSLPLAFSHSGRRFLLVSLAMATALCLFDFGVGWWLGRIGKAGEAERASLLFGLGMNNNGTGLVLISTKLGQFPLLMVPVILFNLVQQVVAGLVNQWMTAFGKRFPSILLAFTAGASWAPRFRPALSSRIFPWAGAKSCWPSFRSTRN